MTNVLKSTIIRDGEYKGFCEVNGYVYQLNGSTYAYKSGQMNKLQIVETV